MKTYANKKLNILGKHSVTFQYKENMLTNFSLYVIAGNGVKPLGCNWLSEVKLDRTIISNRYKEKLNNISRTNDNSEKVVNLVKNYGESKSESVSNERGSLIRNW